MLAPAPVQPLVSSDGLDEDQAARMDAASAAVRRWCGWHIAPQITQTFTVDGDGASRLQLPTLRLVDVVSVANDGDAVDLADLDWSHDGWLEYRRPRAYSFTGGYRAGGFSRRPRGVLVTIEHGFDSVPDIQQVLVDLARRAQPAGVVRKQIGTMSVQYETPGLMQHEMGHLALYRLPSLP